jgi:hypothetical protein
MQTFGEEVSPLVEFAAESYAWEWVTNGSSKKWPSRSIEPPTSWVRSRRSNCESKMAKSADLQVLQVETGIRLLAEISADMRRIYTRICGDSGTTASSAQSGRYAVRNAVSALKGAARSDLGHAGRGVNSFSI